MGATFIGRYGIPIQPGDDVSSFRGDIYTFVRVTRVPEPGKSGKVLVRNESGSAREFYPSVFDGKIVDG